MGLYHLWYIPWVARRPAPGPTDFSRRVVRAVETLRDRARLTNTELIRAAGISANYFYIRLRGEAPFTTNDIEKLAGAFGVEPYEVLQLASSPNPEDGGGELTAELHAGTGRLDAPPAKLPSDALRDAAIAEKARF